MKVYRTCRRLLHGRLRYHHPRSFNYFHPDVLLLLMMTPTPRLLRLQRQLPLTRHPPSFSLLLLVRPLAPPRSNLRLRRRLKVSLISLIHLLKMRREASTLHLRVVKVVARLASTLQRHLVLPVRGLQHLRLHVRRLPSPLHPRSYRPNCRAHDQIRFLRLPSQTVSRLVRHPLLHFPAQAHCPHEHLRHLGPGFRHLAHFAGRA
jgi:hypothetical protein